MTGFLRRHFRSLLPVLVLGLLLLSGGLPSAQGRFPPRVLPGRSVAEPVEGGPAPSPTPWGVNFTWTSDVARPFPVSNGNPDGMGLTGLASDGSELLYYSSMHPPAGNFTAESWLYYEANNSWRELHGMSPGPFANFSLASDDAYGGGSAILFGGENLSADPVAPSNVTWIFSFATSAWQRLSLAQAPSAREDAALAADPSTGNAVLVGGWNDSSGVVKDYWFLNLTASPANWTDLGPLPDIVPGNSGIFGAGLVATGPGHYLLADGCTDAPFTTCTNRTAALTLRGTTPTWSFQASEGPGARAWASWVWDPAASVALLFGGEVPSSSPTFLNDSWEYNPADNRWVRENGSFAPTPRALAPAAWVNTSANQTMFLTGGVLATGIEEQALWRFSPSVLLSVFVNGTGGLQGNNSTVFVSHDANVWTGMTNTTGVAQIIVGSGPIMVKAEHVGAYNASTSLSTLPGQAAHASVVINPLPVLAIRTWRVVQGNLTPFPDVELYWNTTLTYTGTSNATGWFLHRANHGGPVTIYGTTMGYAEVHNATTIPYLGLAFLNLTLLPAPPANVSVHVNSTLGGPVQGASVNVTNYPGANETTDARGWANQTGLSPGDLDASIVGWKEGYYKVTDTVYLPSNSTTVVYLTLEPLPEITVRTWANYSGKIYPLGNADLYSNWSGSLHAVGETDASGWWNSTLPHNGTVRFNATEVGYGSASNFTHVPTTGHVWLNLTLTAEFVKVIVHVEDASTGASLADALVDVVDEQGSHTNATNGAGFANFTAIIPGGDTFVGSLAGYHTNTTPAIVPAGKSFWLNMSLVPWPALHLEVRGSAVGYDALLPLFAATGYRNGTAFGYTIATGWLNVSHVAPGPANVSATHPSYHPAYRDVELNYTGVLNVSLILPPVVGDLEVQVLTPAGGKGTTLVPLPGAQVNVSSTGGNAVPPNVTDGDGWANFTVLQGNYSVTAWSFGFNPGPTEGPYFVGNRSASLPLYRLPGANVSVLVLNRNTSRPIDAATVLFSIIGVSHGNQTNGAGWTNLTDLWPAGTWQAYAVAPGYHPNQTALPLDFREVLPRYVIYLTPLTAETNSTTNTTVPFSLVPASEQTLWWPFLALPIIFFLGATLVVAAQRRRRQ